MYCAYTRPRYQVSVYRTIGPLVTCSKLFPDIGKLQTLMRHCIMQILSSSGISPFIQSFAASIHHKMTL